MRARGRLSSSAPDWVLRLTEAPTPEAVNAAVAAAVDDIGRLAFDAGQHEAAAQMVWGASLMARARRMELTECSEKYRRPTSPPPHEECAA